MDTVTVCVFTSVHVLIKVKMSGSGLNYSAWDERKYYRWMAASRLGPVNQKDDVSAH